MSDDFERMRTQMETGIGFVAALDQSGGSTPKALREYGVSDDEWSGEDEMFAEIHKMRARVIKAPDFTAEKVLGAILFEKTMRGEIDGKKTARALWEDRGVVPFLKVDKGMGDEENGVQLMKPIPGLDDLLAEAKGEGVFGTKMRSVVKEANEEGIRAIVAQQFEVGAQIAGHGLVPILEPEVDIHSPTKDEAERMLKAEILRRLESCDDIVMLKLTIPTTPGLYDDLADHPKVLRVVALSGGYDTEEACRRLSENPKMIASFSRALLEGLEKGLSDEAFQAALGKNIDMIYRASAA